MDDVESISFSSFLAGALLVKPEIGNLELTNYITLFETDYNIYIYDDGIRELSDIVEYNGHGFRLTKEYYQKYKSFCNVAYFLYSITDERIRKFFGYDDKKQESMNIKINLPGFFNKIRTRVLHLL